MSIARDMRSVPEIKMLLAIHAFCTLTELISIDTYGSAYYTDEDLKSK